MKRNKLEVMRQARLRALNFQKINFTTIHLDNNKFDPRSASVTVPYKKFIPEEGSRLFYRQTVSDVLYYRIQFAFCSPSEKNPSRIFGEGLAALRWSNDKSAILLTVPAGGRLIDYLRKAVLSVANMNQISWFKNVTLEDLV